MEESSSSSESSAGQSTSSDTEKGVDGASFMFYFASNYAKLQKQINGCRNQHETLKIYCSNCEAAVYKRLDNLETSISQNAKEIQSIEIQSVLYFFEDLSKRIERIEKDVAKLKISVDDDKEQEKIDSKSTSEQPRLQNV